MRGREGAERWRYFVRSGDGIDYAVTIWMNGEQYDRSREDALDELSQLNEPGAYVWGRRKP